MIRQSSYKKFSLAAHLCNAELGRPNTCQLELTYACSLRCPYCYAGSYNRPEYIAKELNTGQMKKIIDELKILGILWLCLTGGDPLARPDFCELYAYARSRGFLITVFTSGHSLRKKHIELFKLQPPFNIELTLNAVEEALYERISGVKGSFKKTMAAISALRRNKLPLKIKAMVTKLNRHHIGKIREYTRANGLILSLDEFLNAGLKHERCSQEFRLPPEYFYHRQKPKGNGCAVIPGGSELVKKALFLCAAAGGDGFQIDPYGNVSSCSLIHKQDFNVLKHGVGPAVKDMVDYFRVLDFKTDSKCKTCAKRYECVWCPGKAWLETGSLEKPIDYCCRIAKADDN